MSETEKVRLRCGTKNCGVAFEVEKEAIQHDQYIQCPMCSWQGENEFFIGELDESLSLEENHLRRGLRESQNPISKRLQEVVFRLQVTKKWNRTQIAREVGFRSLHYLSLLLNNFDKWWPKTKIAQNRILEKIKKGEELIGETNLNNRENSVEKKTGKKNNKINPENE